MPQLFYTKPRAALSTQQCRRFFLHDIQLCDTSDHETEEKYCHFCKTARIYTTSSGKIIPHNTGIRLKIP